jgi:hypothetical protein
MTTTQTTLNTLANTLDGLAAALAAEGFAASHPLTEAVQQAQAQQAALRADLAGFAQRAAMDVYTVAKAVKEAYFDGSYSCLPALACQLLHTGAKLDAVNTACGGAVFVGGVSEWLAVGELPHLVDMVSGAGAGLQIGGAA